MIQPLRNTRLLVLLAALITSVVPAEDGPGRVEPVAEEVYRGELIAYPGPWGFMPRLDHSGQ